MNGKQLASGRRRSIRYLVVVLTLLVVAYATHAWTLPAIGGWLDVGENPEHADYVMLLNGDRDTRPFEVADLYLNGKAERVMITTAYTDGRLLGPEQHEVQQQILERCGVPASKIDLVDSRVKSTFDEATTLEQFMTEHPQATFSVVTNTYHTRRSRWIFARVLGDRMSRVKFVSAKTDYYNAGNWWKHEDGFVAYLAEFLKSAFYLIRYGNGLAWAAGILVTAAAGVWWMQRKPSSALAE